jgi:hypothetical protein
MQTLYPIFVIASLSGTWQQVNFDFQTLAFGLAAISFGLIGALMAGVALFGEQAERAKRTWLPTSIQGLILVMVSTFLLGILQGG